MSKIQTFKKKPNEICLSIANKIKNKNVDFKVCFFLNELFDVLVIKTN